MRFVVYGAGAIGGVIGGRLYEHGHDVVLVARGRHLRAVRDAGLRIESPDGTATLPIPAVEHPAEVSLTESDVVLLAVKSQDTGAALDALVAVAPPGVAVACAQNGVENERAALRLFPRVYGVHVMLPATHMEPGVVQASSAPVTGMLDLGRYPAGADDTAAEIAAAFNASTFDSQVRVDILRWKYRKLIMNLGNAVEAVIEPGRAADEIDRLAQAEGESVLRAAGIEFASRDEDRARRRDLLRIKPIAGRERGGGSTWQSLARGAETTEADYLNGEVVLLGRLHAVPTPVNEALQRLARRWARERRRPGTLTAAEFERRLANE